MLCYDFKYFSDKSFICLAAYDKTLVHISIKFRSGDTTWQSDVGGNSAPDMDLVFAADRKHLQCLMTQLNPMSTPRCGFGVAVIENSIVVVGGYFTINLCLVSVVKLNLP